MASYRIEWKRSTAKDFRRIQPQDAIRIVEAVEGLSSDPFPVGHVKLSGSEGSYRIRIGDYRVIYEVIAEVLVIHVIRVGHRREIYR